MYLKLALVFLLSPLVSTALPVCQTHQIQTVSIVMRASIAIAFNQLNADAAQALAETCEEMLSREEEFSSLKCMRGSYVVNGIIPFGICQKLEARTRSASTTGD